MTEEIRRACRMALRRGYRNIDIDSSTLVDLLKPTTDEQQRENYVRAAELTALIRSLEAEHASDDTVSVGGEIGEVGKEDFHGRGAAGVSGGVIGELERRAPGARGCGRSASRRRSHTGGGRCRGGGRRSSSTSSGRRLGDVAGLRAAVRSSTVPRRCLMSCSITSRR